jgi:hypothetical protein
LPRPYSLRHPKLREPCSLANGPGGEWLTHYCPHCGIRLLTFFSPDILVRSIHHVFATSNNLTSVSRFYDKKGATFEGRQLKWARSPFGPPSDKVDAASLTGFTERYRKLRRKLSMITDWDKKKGTPAALWDIGHSQMVYEVSFPDFDPADKFDAKHFFVGKRERAEACETGLSFV